MAAEGGMLVVAQFGSNLLGVSSLHLWRQLFCLDRKPPTNTDVTRYFFRVQHADAQTGVVDSIHPAAFSDG